MKHVKIYGVALSTVLAFAGCNAGGGDGVSLGAPSGNQSANPYESVIPTLLGTVPPDVTIPQTSEPTTEADTPNAAAVFNRPFFDEFSWQSFIALNWPADASNRGVPLNPGNPATFLSANQSGAPSSPTVWGTYREGFELFPPKGGTLPPEWNSPEHGYSPAGSEHDGKRIFAMSTKGGLLDEVNEAFGGPLIDQNGNFTRYEVRINKAEYEQVRQNKWYDKTALTAAIEATLAEQKAAGQTIPQGIQFDNNTLELKAAWRQMTADDDTSRYYTVEGLIASDDGTYVSAKMGLVGMHIMQKTATFPQWVWSTFEHVDNVTGIHPSYNNGTDRSTTPPNAADCKDPILTPAQAKAKGFDCEPFEIAAPYKVVPMGTGRPVQVTRIDPIPDTPKTPAGYSTQGLNAQYQALLAGTVWENYELISTQWPTDPSLRSPYDPDFAPDDEYKANLAGNPFPKHSANVTMETYFQDNSCMQCHYHAAAFGTDYSWIMANRVLEPKK